MHIINDGMRSILWGLAKLFLAVTDWIQEIFVFIVHLDFGNSEVIYAARFFFTSLLTIACLVYIAKNYIKAKALGDGEIQKKNFLGRIALIGLAIVITPQLLSVSTRAPGFLYDTFEKAIVFDTEVVPSTAIISVTAKTSVSSKLADMTSTDELIDIKTIDDKLNDRNDDDDYIYFDSIAELVLCGVAAGIFVFTELSLLLSCGSRVLINLFLFIISFIPIASILDEHPKIGEWFRDVVAESITIGSMLIMTTVVYALMGTKVMTQANPIIQLAVLIIFLTCIQGLGNIIAKYLNASDLKGNSKLGMGGFVAFKMAKTTIKGIARSIGQVGSGIADGSISAATSMMRENLSNAQNMINDNSLFSHSMQQDSAKQNSYFASTPSFNGSNLGQNVGTNYQNENFFDRSNPMSNGANFNVRSTKDQFVVEHLNNDSKAAFSSSADTSNLNNVNQQQGEMTAKDYQHNIETAQTNLSRFNDNYGQFRKRGLFYSTGYAIGNFAGKNVGNQMFNKMQSYFVPSPSYFAASPFRSVMPSFQKLTNWTKPNIIYTSFDKTKGMDDHEKND